MLRRLEDPACVRGVKRPVLVPVDVPQKGEGQSPLGFWPSLHRDLHILLLATQDVERTDTGPGQ